MAELSPPSSSVEAHESGLPRPKVRSDQALRSISSEVDIISPGPSGETPPTPPATTRASTAISGAAETDNEDDEETTVGVPILVVDEPASEQVPAPERTPPLLLPPAPPIQTVDYDVTNVDITTTPATPKERPMPAFKTSQKRDTPERSSKPRPPPVLFARPLSEFPPTPSTLSRVLNEEGLQSPGLTISVLPPSPPLTRRGTNSTRTTTSSSSRYGPRTVAALDRASSASDRTVTRPGTSSSGTSIKDTSVKDVSKLGKRLGRQPADYLVPNGSLSKTISINFHPLQEPHSLKTSPGTDGPVASIFRNLNVLIDSYLAILSNGGSVAVANGYHSEARKLLEQVGGLFTRDLGVDGVGWSDILEYIRGDRDRPCLCVLPVKGLLSRRNIEATILSGTGADDETVSQFHTPSQFITKELAESVVAGVKRKTGKVEDWLEEVEKVLRRTAPPPSPSSLNSVPEDGEVDEHGEIVVQIIEGILNQNQIAVFRSYLKDTRFLASTKLALVRLYPQHTATAITAPIIALYLLLHDELHPLLEAVSGLSDAEMELINSGRLDSFLDGSSNAIPRDEEEELATISRLDRNLWRVLEGLEDEIEELHSRALVIRRALKERKDGIAKKFKKRSLQALVEGDIPIPLQLLGETQEDENVQLLAPVEEWEGGQSMLLGPDDSASNVTFNRRRRVERRAEKEKLVEGERKKLEKKLKKVEEKGEPRDEKEMKKEREKEERKEKERDGKEGKDERREKRREKKEVEEEVEGGEGTVVGSGKSVHKKERREKKDRREKMDCDIEGCEECGSTVKRPRSRKREGEESEKLEEIKEGKELKHTHRSHKDSKEVEKPKEEKEKDKDKEKEKEKEKDKKDKDEKGGLLNSIGRWVDKKITIDKPSKEDKKKEEKERLAELREKERPATAHSHRDPHSHRERDYREGYRETHREVKAGDVADKW